MSEKNVKDKILEELVIDEESYNLGREHREKEVIRELKNLIESNQPFKDEAIFLKNYRLIEEEKIKELAKIWCQWNARELDPGEAMGSIGDLFDEWTKNYWTQLY